MQYETFDVAFSRNLDTLKEEILAYKDEKNLWKLAGDIKNSPGTIVLHLCGNLKHNIGAVIGQNGFIRKRDEEFSRRDVSRNELVNEIDSTREIIAPILKQLVNDDLAKEFPSDQFNQYDKAVTIGWVITRLAFHFGYHLGQVNYHRRILEY